MPISLPIIIIAILGICLRLPSQDLFSGSGERARRSVYNTVIQGFIIRTLSLPALRQGGAIGIAFSGIIIRTFPRRVGAYYRITVSFFPASLLAAIIRRFFQLTCASVRITKQSFSATAMGRRTIRRSRSIDIARITLSSFGVGIKLPFIYASGNIY
jgi:hypothetical protein